MFESSAEHFMRRSIELAQLGMGQVAPNPMVGAVLVHQGTIIGEGYHRQYGGPHAEVNCLDAVLPDKRALISSATMYVSLEPCAHHGKTPPCADLILSHKIPQVVVGCRDPFPEVDGKGIERLIAGGVSVKTGILEEECKRLNKRFFTFHTKHRPYVVLKWAQTANGKMGLAGEKRLHISGSFANRLVHKWRSEESSIMVGTNTAALDDPQLNNRLWTGASPVRMVIDMDLRLPESLHLFDRSIKTIIFNTRRHSEEENLIYYGVTADTNIVHQVLHALYHMKMLSVMIEGGAQLLQSFIDDGSWDEARIITNSQLKMGAGVYAPELSNETFHREEKVGEDRVQYFIRK